MKRQLSVHAARAELAAAVKAQLPVCVVAKIYREVRRNDGDVREECVAAERYIMSTFESRFAEATTARALRAEMDECCALGVSRARLHAQEQRIVEMEARAYAHALTSEARSGAGLHYTSAHTPSSLGFMNVNPPRAPQPKRAPLSTMLRETPCARRILRPPAAAAGSRCCSCCCC